MNEQAFLIRVYGIFIDPIKGLLVSDEFIKGRNITKFPGGGLEYGEGTIDCLVREMFEETGNQFEVVSHFYTTDYFVESAFHTNKQVISIYYMIKPVSELKLRIAEKPFEFEGDSTGSESFRFIPLEEISPEQFTLSIDRHVASMISQNHKRV